MFSSMASMTPLGDGGAVRSAFLAETFTALHHVANLGVSLEVQAVMNSGGSRFFTATRSVWLT